MKKTMWILSIISIVLTAVALQFMPDLVPMHYNAAGEIDRQCQMNYEKKD